MWLKISGLYRNCLAFLLFLQPRLLLLMFLFVLLLFSYLTINRQQCEMYFCFFFAFDLLSFSLSLFHRLFTFLRHATAAFLFLSLFLCTILRKWLSNWRSFCFFLHLLLLSELLVVVVVVIVVVVGFVFVDYNIWFCFPSAQTNKTHLNLLWVCTAVIALLHAHLNEVRSGRSKRRRWKINSKTSRLWP